MLNNGTKLGPYEVAGAIGAGGMGEVYRARDTRLGRDVALKILPEAFATDAERLRRFEQEARAASALNHPNILAIYDIGANSGAPFLVTELLEGETLRERLRSGALPVRKALDIAMQSANGVAAAHEKGIIHRDLKPANIFLTSDGRVKILDFGLAKLVQREELSVSDTQSPTRTSGGHAATEARTEAGVVLGTAGYMSPEQVRGKPADARSDIFALGTILYEMLSGERAFEKDSSADTMAAILKEEPPELSGEGKKIPPAVDRVVRHCLEKNPAERFQSARDFAFNLAAISDVSSSSAKIPPLAAGAATSTRKRRTLFATIGTAGLIVVAVVAFYIGRREGNGALAWLSPGEANAPPTMAYISAPPGTSFRSYGFGAGPAAVSPDGKEIAFSATDEKGVTRIWLRPLAGGDAKALAGTEDGGMPFWSPDAQSVGFFAGEKLKTINMQNGTVQVLADASCWEQGASATWSVNGVIIFTPQCNAPMARIPAGGGAPQTLSETSNGSNPAFLPGGEKFLYVSAGQNQPSTVRMASLSTGKSKLVLNDASAPQFASGYLLFLREGKVFAQRFDAASGQVTGDASPLAEALSFSASNNGVLVSQGGTANARLQWFDRSGNALGTIGDVALWRAPKISPDGKQVLAQKGGTANWDFWSYPVTGGIGTRLTFSQGYKGFSVWSPDGKYIAYGCYSGATAALCRKPLDGSGTEETLLELAADVAGIAVVDWSPDGRYLSFDESDAHRRYSNWVLPLGGGGKPFRSAPVASSQYDGNFSPDGHWLAYFSYEAGRPEVFVVPFPPTGGKYQISQTGGWLARWATGDRLFYVTMGNRLMEADLATNGKSLQVKSIHALFQMNLPQTLAPMYDVTPDGNRFIVATSADPAAASSIRLVTNWPALLKKQ